MRFGADRAIVGRTVQLAGTPVRIVGVAERRFTGPEVGAPDMWLPVGSAPAMWPGQGPFHAASTAAIGVVGQLTPGATIESATKEVSGILQTLAAGGIPTSLAPATGVDAAPADNRDLPRGRVIARFVLAAIGLVLLLASVNVANLLLASATGRRREMAVRFALGASRGRLLRQLLTESLALAAVSGALGLLAATWLMPVLASLVGLGADVETAPDATVYGFLAAASLVAGLVSGLAPARASTRGDLLAGVRLGGGSTAGSSPPRRLRAVFVGVQAAASVVLLIGAALLTRALVHATSVDLGFDANRLVAASVSMPRSVDAARRAAFWNEALDRITALPGVESAAVAFHVPLDQSSTASSFPDGRKVDHNLVTAEYFATAGLRLTRGRTFTADEVRHGAKVAVVTNALARDVWGDEDPVGKSLGRVNGSFRDIEVVGVVADAITSRLEEPRPHTVYQPLLVGATPRESIVVRGRQDAGSVLAPVLQALQNVEPTFKASAWPVARSLERVYRQARTLATLGAIAGALALGLALLGIFSVTAFIVGQRTREIGVRVAVGAEAADVVRLFVGEGVRPLVAGLVAGLGVAVAGANVLAGVMYGVSPRDPAAIGAAVLGLLLSGIAAIVIPARRAARVDPARILRQE
jgi:predicted permease